MGRLKHTAGFLSLMYRANGWQWTLCCCVKFLLERGLGIELVALDKRMRRLEAARQLPGVSSAELNQQIWNQWDWSQQGEEWTPSPAWKQSVVTHVMHRWLSPDTRLLEIGPGAGRWTEFLQAMARELVIVDVAEACIQQCRARFRGLPHLRYHVNDGRSLPFVPDASVDGIWSFDVFVHIDPGSSERYVQEFARVLQPGGIGVIHHGVDGRSHTGWRSRTTREHIQAFCEHQQLRVLAQFDEWGEQPEFNTRFHHALITVFQKP